MYSPENVPWQGETPGSERRGYDTGSVAARSWRVGNSGHVHHLSTACSNLRVGILLVGNCHRQDASPVATRSVVRTTPGRPGPVGRAGADRCHQRRPGETTLGEILSWVSLVGLAGVGVASLVLTWQAFRVLQCRPEMQPSKLAEKILRLGYDMGGYEERD